MNPKNNNKSHYAVSMRERERERERERVGYPWEAAREEAFDNWDEQERTLQSKERERERESHRRLAEQVSEWVQILSSFLHKEERILLYKTKVTYKLTWRLSFFIFFREKTWQLSYRSATPLSKLINLLY